MRWLSAVLLLAIAAAAETPLSLEEKLLATVPAEHDEKQKMPDPDGNMVEVGGIILAWSPDGTRVAWLAHSGGRNFGVVDGEKGEISTFADGIVFSPDGKHVAWRAGNRTKDDKAERWWIAIDGKKQAEFDLLGPPRFSPDSARVAHWGNEGAYIAKDGSYAGGKWFVVDGGKRLPGDYSDSDYFTPPVFSPDGKSLAYVASPKQGQSVVVAFGKASEAYALADTPAFSPDGKQIAWGAIKDDRWTVWHNGMPIGREFDHAGIPVFAPKGGALAFVGISKGKKFVVVAGKKSGGDFDGIGAPVFSPDGKAVAFTGNRGGTGFGPPGGGATAADPYLLDREEPGLQGGEWRVVAGGKEGEAFDGVQNISWSADGKAVAYAAKKGAKWRVVAGSTKSAEFEEVGPPRFSADGKKVAFGARVGLELWWKVVEVR